MGVGSLKPAVFLDRDGVLNFNVLNPANGFWESPYHPDDFRLYPDAVFSLRRLQEAGYLLFLVSNQPAYAKGTASLENIQAIAEALRTAMEAKHIHFTEYYYCLHHPKGVVPGYSGPCPCRKPAPFFLHEAEKNFGVNLTSSWMIGDRYTDIQCGHDAGTQTILIKNDNGLPGEVTIEPDFTERTLTEAVETILSNSRR
jgi:D-glycero-D-manno-heptose 1,7-bisphosphate phosphatase